MPKLKTNKSVKKRFKVSKNKKVLFSKSRRRHLLTSKTSKKKRSLRGSTVAHARDTGKILKLLPYA